MSVLRVRVHVCSFACVFHLRAFICTFMRMFVCFRMIRSVTECFCVSAFLQVCVIVLLRVCACSHDCHTSTCRRTYKGISTCTNPADSHKARTRKHMERDRESWCVTALFFSSNTCGAFFFSMRSHMFSVMDVREESFLREATAGAWVLARTASKRITRRTGGALEQPRQRPLCPEGNKNAETQREHSDLARSARP